MKYRPKALTLWPEWAHAICHLGKRVENRSWNAPINIINQRICIHAGKYIGGGQSKDATVWGLEAVADMSTTGGWKGGEVYKGSNGFSVCLTHDKKKISHVISESNIITSAIVAVVTVTGCFRPEITSKPWAAKGHKHWYLDDVTVLKEPVKSNGKQSLWRISESQYDEIVKQCGKDVFCVNKLE